MNVLLTGATGFLGYRALEKMVEQPFVKSIVATGRTLVPERTVKHKKVTYKLGDLENTGFVNEIVTPGTDCIVNAASLSSPWGAVEKFVAANVVTQDNLINASIYNGVGMFVYISTPSVYFNHKDRLLIKESAPLPGPFVNEYAKTKREAEILLEQSILPYIILRPRALIGRGDSVIMPRLIRAFDEGKLKIIGNGQNMVDLTSVENVADAIMLSITAKGNAVNQTYNISNGEPVKLWESIRNVLQLLNKELGAKSVPYTVAKSFARFLEFKSKLTNNKEPALTTYGVGTLAKSFTLDISKARELLNYRPVVSTRQSIEEFVTWYKNKNENA